MSLLDKTTLVEKFNNASTGLFKNGQSRGIGSDDMRVMIADLADSLAFVFQSYVVTASGTDTYTATLVPAIAAYAAGQKVFIKFTNANTGAATINLNTLGAKAIVKSGGEPLSYGDISAGQILCLVYDGTNFQVVGGGGGGVESIAGVYATIAAMLADQAAQLENAFYYVTDASTDATVDAGWAIYRKLSASTANIADYVKVMEQESLDLVVTNASETAKGIVEEATDAETAAGTAVGGTGAKLFVTPAKLLTWWAAIKAAAQSISGLWTFAKAKLTHGAFGYTVLTDAANIAWNADTIGNTAQVTLGGNRTLDAITNPQAGGIYILRVVQAGTGGRTITFNAAYTFPETSQRTISTVAGAATTFMFFYDGTAFRFITNGAKGKLNIGSNTEFETLADASDVYSIGMFSRLGAVFKSAYVKWNESLKQLSVEGTQAIWSAFAGVTNGNMGIKTLQDVTEAFKLFDDNGNFYSNGIEDSKRLNRFRDNVRLYNGTAYNEAEFKTTQVEDETIGILKTIEIPANSVCIIDVLNIAAQSESKEFIVGSARFVLQNDAGTLTDVGNSTLDYSNQFSSLGAIDNTTSRIDIVVDDGNDEVDVVFINEDTEEWAVQCEIKYTIVSLPEVV